MGANETGEVAEPRLLPSGSRRPARVPVAGARGGTAAPPGRGVEGWASTPGGTGGARRDRRRGRRCADGDRGGGALADDVHRHPVAAEGHREDERACDGGTAERDRAESPVPCAVGDPDHGRAGRTRTAAAPVPAPAAAAAAPSRAGGRGLPAAAPCSAVPAAGPSSATVSGPVTWPAVRVSHGSHTGRAGTRPSRGRPPRPRPGGGGLRSRRPRQPPRVLGWCDGLTLERRDLLAAREHLSQGEHTADRSDAGAEGCSAEPGRARHTGEALHGGPEVPEHREGSTRASPPTGRRRRARPG